ncbi:hypothetical protein A9Q98_13735 [Thalassotalea sp. 42_200_T64]|nr:hypothetical protein A9Q98_13735 [Thalassotalea sp. 42_200_T64]
MINTLRLGNRSKNQAVDQKAQFFKINLTTVWLLLLSQVFNIAMVAQELSFWMLATIFLCLAWRVLLIRQPSSKPQRFIFLLLTISGCIAIAITSRQLGLLLAMLHLLCFSYALKALELNSRKDFYQLVVLGLFILATSLIFKQSLLFTGVLALIIVFNFALLLHYFSSAETVSQTLTRCGKMLLQSLPLALVLFVVFPRLAPFWQVPLANSAKTGLSDNVTPGDIANLARSNELAFRVTFNDEKPLYSQLYWRALVLEQYNGTSWLRTKEKKRRAWLDAENSQQYTPQVSGPSLNYQVITQPSFRRWLFGLDIAVVNPQTTAQSVIIERPDFTLQSKDIISQTLSYQVNSFLEAPLDITLTREMKERNLQYPLGSNPRLELEAARLRQLYADNNDLVQAVLGQFRQQQYFYTLKPPTLVENSLDQFYFDTKTGFCVHYASAFTYLMRAAGIPARMVTGYMGGEYNPEGNYYSIYQYEAHAWTEIWLQGFGWKRIDPTAAVDPERVESGFSQQLINEQSSLSDNFFSLSNYKNSKWLNALRLKLSAMDYQWTKWVIGYSSKQQIELLSRWFGQMLPWKTGLLIGLAFVVVMISLWLLQQQKVPVKRLSPWLKLYQKALSLLIGKEVEKPKAMSVSDFVVTVNRSLPNIARNFTLLSDCFIQLEYQNLTEQQQKTQIKAMQIQLKAIKKQI